MRHLARLFGLILVVSATCFSLVAGQKEEEEAVTVVETIEDQPGASWEYEPRVWAPDEPNETSDEFGDQYEYVFEEIELPSKEDQHKQHNFVNQKTDLRQKVQGEDCTQFRVDTREAIICDKKRCDKFDFIWPTYDNQIAVVQTTKDGMRFHRQDFAMAPGNTKQQYAKMEKGKNPFDLFELFKPKPSTTTPATTTTTTGTTTSSSSTESEAPATSAPSTTSPSDNTTTTSTTEKQPTDARDVTDQDTNSTRLVTTFRLDTKRTAQTMIGFGGALTDSTCRNIKSLSPQMSKSIMEDYYGDRGLRYNIVRMTMGSSDFSTTPYTNNDQIKQKSQQAGRLAQADDAMEDDVEMKNFRLVDEDYNYKLPAARQAIATSKQELKFFSSLWSPPIWMKNNSNIVYGFLKGDVYGPYYKGLAEYIIRWLEAYRKNGVEFWGTTGLNEPITGIKPFIFHNSMGITREDYITWIKIHLGPMLRQRGFQDLKLIMLDDNKGYASRYVRAALDDPEAAKYISGIGIHWYMNDEYENLNFIPKKYPDKFILSTEACNGYMGFQVHALPGNWDRGVAYMYDIIKTIQKNSAGWVDWNMALDLTGGPSWAKNNLDAAIIVNAKRDEYYKSPMFYAMGHFSKFVEPNSKRLDYRIAYAKYDYPLEAVAFHTPQDYIVIVVLNSNKHPTPFRIIVDKQLVRVITLRAESFGTIVFKWKPKTQ